MAAQKQEKHSSKMKNIHNYRRKIKRKKNSKTGPNQHMLNMFVHYIDFIASKCST